LPKRIGTKQRYLVHLVIARGGCADLKSQKYRLAAEDVYKEIDEFTPASDSKAREYLQDLRDDLDEVAQGQEEDKLEPGGAQEESTSKEEEKADEQDPLEILRATMVVRRQLARYPDEVGFKKSAVVDRADSGHHRLHG
jgi:hypothetical protein